MRKFLMFSVVAASLAACGDDRPDLPTDEEAGKFIVTGLNHSGSDRTELLSVSCAYAVITILAMKAIIALFGDGGFWVETTMLLVILLAFVLAGLIEERISQRHK